MDDSKASRAKGEFKKTLDVTAGRTKRQLHTTRLRKTARQDRLAKKRSENVKLTDEGLDDALSHLEQHVFEMQTGDETTQLKAVTQVRKLLSLDREPPIDEIIHVGALPVLIHLLQNSPVERIQFEAAWALTNIASGTDYQTRAVMDAGAIPIFVDKLLTGTEKIQDQVCWALGNIAGEGIECRDILIENDVIKPLVNVLQTQESLTTIVRNGVWTLSNLCRGKPAPPMEIILPAVGLLAHYVYYSDEEILTDACWALSYVSDGKPPYIQMVLETGCLMRIVNLMVHSRPSIHVPCLRIIGNVCTGTEQQTQAAINVGALGKLAALIQHPKKHVRKETCWTLSNVTAGNRSQIQAVCDAGLVPLLLGQMDNAEFEVQREACWTISNIASGGSDEQIAFLVENDCLPRLVKMFLVKDLKTVLVSLEGLDKLLNAGKRRMENEGLLRNPYTVLVEECGGIEIIDKLQKHRNENVFNLVSDIIDKYFPEDEDDGDVTGSYFGVDKMDPVDGYQL